MTTCHDLMQNEADLKKIKELFTGTQKNLSPASALFPWFPSPSKKAGKKATAELFAILYAYVEARRGAEPTSDWIDVLIADGETTWSIAEASFAPRGRARCQT